MGFIYNLLFFPTVKKFEKWLRFDKVIAISWVVHFFWDTVYIKIVHRNNITWIQYFGSVVVKPNFYRATLC